MMTTEEITSLEVTGTRTPAQVIRMKYDIQQILEKVLEGPSEENRNGVHYGPAFPGSKGKYTLKLPGAQTLASTFGICPRYEVTEIPDGLGRRYQVKTKLFSRSGLFLGEGIGEASTEEEKFAWQETVCDAEWDGTDPLLRRVKYKKERDEIREIKQVRSSVADKSNTCLKMGKKRSLVDGIILVLDCSDIFDQDYEELGDELGIKSDEPKKPKPPKLGPAPKIPYGRGAGKQINDPEVTLQALEECKANLEKNLANPKRDPKFDGPNKALIPALEKEIAHRKVEPKSHPAPAESTPVSRKPFNDHAWRDMVMVWEEQYESEYLVTLQDLNYETEADVPADQRWVFFDAVEAEIKKRQ
jgi:hypothetical protein